MPHSRTLVLAFDGDASAADLIGRLSNRLSADVVTVTVDLGQGGDLELAREQALAAGAARAHVVDARERFAAEVLLPVLRAGAAHPAATTPASLARPIVAAVAVDVARIERALRSRMVREATRASRSSASSPTRRRIFRPWHSKISLPSPVCPGAPSRRISGAAWSDAGGRRRRSLRSLDLHAYHRSDGGASASSDCRVDVPPWPADRYQSDSDAVPELVEVLDTIAGDHGVGRADRTRRSGMRVEREIGESPAAVTLAAALDELERTGPRRAPLDAEDVAGASICGACDRRWLVVSRSSRPRRVQRRRHVRH